MIQKSFFHILELLKSLQLPNGGFPYLPGEEARPDTTAWAIIPMAAFDFDLEACARGRNYLVTRQSTDGGVSISPTHPDASWPTPLAILAWQDSSHFQPAQQRAIQFLLKFSGHHIPKPTRGYVGHDPSILGWPWIDKTHSWVLPTALAIIALQQVGLGMHSRVAEGQRMLLDRQLPHGGWNYGNTFVFGKELHPLPECTGIALQALVGMSAIGEIEHSLNYLLRELPSLKTPISLGWALLGLGAWGLKPANTEELILGSLQSQKRYGPYPFPWLALLLCSAKAPQGLRSLFRSWPQDGLSSSLQ